MLELYKRTAEHLTGKRVQVRVREPATVKTRGELSRRGDVFYIDISPRLDTDEVFQVFLHEVAHIVLDSERMVSSDVPHLASGSLHKGTPYTQHEDRVQGLADRLYWLAEEGTSILTPYRMLLVLLEL